MEDFNSAEITNDMVQSILLQLPLTGAGVEDHMINGVEDQDDAFFQIGNTGDHSSACYGFLDSSTVASNNLHMNNRDNNVFIETPNLEKRRQFESKEKQTITGNTPAPNHNADHTSSTDSDNSKSPLKGAGVRRRKRARYVGGGARALKVPEDEEFAIGLEKPIADMLQPGKRKLNTLQMQKFKDATEALQQMHIHRLEPLTLYTDCQLYDLMASVAESWKNSGKTAWKKRIHKIKENARYRKQPRKNTLDKDELEEIAQLEQKIKEREEWESREKAKLEYEKKMKKRQKRKLLGKPKPAHIAVAKWENHM